MSYMIFSALIVTVTAIRGLSFAVWNFKRKNIIGGIAVSLLSVSPVILIYITFIG